MKQAMTHTSTEQSEALRLAHALGGGKLIDDSTEWADTLHAAAAELRHQHARIAELEAELEAAQAQRVPLSEVMNLVSEWGMASHANGEAALDAHNPDATPDEIAYADECVQSERAAWKAIEDKLRAHGITQEKQL